MSTPTVTCSRCGNAVAPDDIFCSYCNNKLPEYEMSLPRPAAANQDHAAAADDDPAERTPRRRPATWKLVAAAAALVAMVVGVVLVATGGDDPRPPSASSLAVMRQLPAERWHRDIVGRLVASLTDGAYTTIVVFDGTTFEVTSLETTTGRSRWSHTIEPTGEVAPDDAFGQLQQRDGRITALIGSQAVAHRDVVVLDLDTGRQRWQAELDAAAFGFVGPDVVGALGTDHVAGQVVDDHEQSLSAPIEAERWFETDDATYSDDGTTLTRVVPINGPVFRYDHTGQPVVDLAEIEGGAVVIGVGDRVSSLSSVGERRWSVSSQVGQVAGVQAMSGDRVVVIGDEGLRIVSSLDGSDVTRDSEDFPFAVADAGPDGQDALFAFPDGIGGAGEKTLVAVLSLSGGKLSRLANITGFYQPSIASAGSIAYVTEEQRTESTERTMRAIELPGGRELWTLPLATTAVTTITGDGILVADMNANASLQFFGPAPDG